MIEITYLLFVLALLGLTGLAILFLSDQNAAEKRKHLRADPLFQGLIFIMFFTFISISIWESLTTQCCEFSPDCLLAITAPGAKAASAWLALVSLYALMYRSEQTERQIQISNNALLISDNHKKLLQKDNFRTHSLDAVKNTYSFLDQSIEKIVNSIENDLFLDYPDQIKANSSIINISKVLTLSLKRIEKYPELITNSTKLNEEHEKLIEETDLILDYIRDATGDNFVALQTQAGFDKEFILSSFAYTLSEIFKNFPLNKELKEVNNIYTHTNAFLHLIHLFNEFQKTLSLLEDHDKLEDEANELAEFAKRVKENLKHLKFDIA